MKIFVSLRDDRANAPSEMKRSEIELQHGEGENKKGASHEE